MSDPKPAGVHVLCALLCALAACADAGAAPTPTDGGAAKADPGQLGGGGLGGGQTSTECMPATDAVRLSKPPKSDDGGAAVAPESTEVPECPTFFWAQVTSGHGMIRPQKFRAPLSVAASRKQRKRKKHDCCYLIPVSGNPGG